MNKCKLAALLVVLPITTACTTFTSSENTGTPTSGKELKLPNGLNDPLKSNEFEIPKKGPRAEFSEEITSPTTVLIMLDGSWVESGEKHPAKIMIEKPQLVDDLAKFIDDGIQSYFDNNNGQLNKIEKGYSAQSTVQKETGFWFWENNQDVENIDYAVSVNILPHGRTASIQVDINSYDLVNPKLASKLPEAQRKEALSVQTLNNIMLELDYLYRVQIKKEQTELELSLDLVKNVSDNFVIRSQQDIKNVWSQTEDVLEDIGFDIEEDDEELYVFELQYDASEGTPWYNFWSSDIEALNLDSGKYEVSLTSTTTGVHIVFKDSNGNYLSEQQMQDVYEKFKFVVERDELEL